MIKPTNLLYIFGVIATLLVVIAIFNMLTQAVFGKLSKLEENREDLIYDPDVGGNTTAVCMLDTGCENKTLWLWYIPWMRHHVQRQYEKKFLITVQEEEEEEENEVLLEGEAATSDQPPVADEVEVEDSDNDTGKKHKERPSQVVYTMLAGILAVSSCLACLEVAREKLKARGQVPGEAKAGRRCSLAEFRMNKHLRRESQQLHAQHVDHGAQGTHGSTAKVTLPLVHQGSLDRAISKMTAEVRPPLLRRCSGPVYFTNSMTNIPAMDKLKKQSSCDVSGDEMTPEMRRKSRHFIRRH